MMDRFLLFPDCEVSWESSRATIHEGDHIKGFNGGLTLWTLMAGFADVGVKYDLGF
jgi:hypothetical protein